MTRWFLAVFVTCLVARPASAQVPPRPASSLQRALDAERRGAYAEAATLFTAILDERPADGGAIAGLERVLVSLGRIAEFAPRLARALDADSTNIGFLGLAVRTFATIGQGDSAARYADRWARLEPGQEAPYREWATSAVEGRDPASARRAIDAGRARIARPGTLAPESAMLLQLEGNWAASAAEWIRAVDASPAYRITAALSLARAAANQREAVRTALTTHQSPEAARVLGLVMLRWGDVTDGAAAILRSLPTDAEPAIVLLRAGIDETRGRESRDVLRARASMLEAVADRQAGQVAVRTRMDAARSFADGGDERSARRLLARVAGDRDAPPGMATTASATLLGVLVAEGKADEAERVLTELAPSLDADERERQFRRVAMAHARNGRFGRADSLVQGDSSVAGLDVRGRIRLLQGDLAAATEYFKAAGPYDDEREQAVERVTILALLQAVGTDTSAALGAALGSLERGDTVSAVRAMDGIAMQLGEAGAAETRLLAGRLAMARGDSATAQRLLLAANVPTQPATAAAARVSLARLAIGRGRMDEAITLLESLILEFPESAVAPEARRLLDVARGAVPGRG